MYQKDWEPLLQVLYCPSHHNDDKLLGLPQLGKANGIAQIKTNFHLVEMLYLRTQIKLMVSDTTAASNIQWKTGAVKILQTLLKKKLFYISRNYHIYKLVFKCAIKFLKQKLTT